jgi:hypothetical protein
MVVRQRRYSKEELARRGQELYESGIQQQVEVGNDGKIVAITSGRLTPTISKPEILRLMKLSWVQPIGYLSVSLMLNLGRFGLGTMQSITLVPGV